MLADVYLTFESGVAIIHIYAMEASSRNGLPDEGAQNIVRGNECPITAVAFNAESASEGDLK
jgi:hypothetical protein